jgi:hypothetical protein
MTDYPVSIKEALTSIAAGVLLGCAVVAIGVWIAGAP